LGGGCVGILLISVVGRLHSVKVAMRAIRNSIA
jgi:hypothetical protein